jgi:flagellar biosynthesis protein FlhG
MAGHESSCLHEGKKYTWAIGGGKGGTGKTFLAANLGIQLTRLGRPTVIVDADLGGANLHTCLGIKYPKATIADFISRNISSLSDLVLETPIEGLHIISAARDVFEIANPTFQQKERLIRHIKKLPFEFIIIDVGGGSSFNVVDFFLCADTGITVACPEPTSVENAYRFLKSALLRKLYRTADGRYLKETIRGALSKSEGKEIKTIHDFIQQVKPYNGIVAERLELALNQFRPFLILNQSRNEDDSQLGQSIEDIAQKYLGVELSFIGAIPYDERVHFSVKRFKPLLAEYPASQAASSIETIVNSLLTEAEGKDSPIRQHASNT